MLPETAVRMEAKCPSIRFDIAATKGNTRLKRMFRLPLPWTAKACTNLACNAWKHFGDVTPFAAPQAGAEHVRNE
jgi:hypothetical protein